MQKINFKSKLINTLPNINGLDEIKTALFNAQFIDEHGIFVRKINLHKSAYLKSFKQIITLKEEINLNIATRKIKEMGYEGFLMPTFFLEESLKSNPLPLSAQKQNIIENICKMNNGSHNEAEGIFILHNQHENFTPIFHTLPPNLPAQLISTIHENRTSRLTLGEAKSITSITDASPYGEALLQISHLTYHALDLDMSIEVSDENFGKNKKIKEKVSVFESCFSIPYSLNTNAYSHHGYILYLKGQQITPQKIQEIIGLQSNGFGGIIIASGKITSSVLSHKHERKLFGTKKTFVNRTYISEINEAIGSYIFEPATAITAKGLVELEKIGNFKSADGEIILAFYPFLQTFVGEY